MKIFGTQISGENQFKNFAKVRKEGTKFHKDFWDVFRQDFYELCFLEIQVYYCNCHFSTKHGFVW